MANATDQPFARRITIIALGVAGVSDCDDDIAGRRKRLGSIAMSCEPAAVSVRDKDQRMNCRTAWIGRLGKPYGNLDGLPAPVLDAAFLVG
ncbi:hypothetical protein QBK99_19590 [Corticibacterium sp. UT-5YL-CI-8]|nr:hypothetical protein [Tianweitania sp. UT-5YL-CI-8]